MEDTRTHTEIFHHLLANSNSLVFARHKENITTIILGLDLLEVVNESRNNRELVQIVRHSLQQLLEAILDDETMNHVKPP